MESLFHINVCRENKNFQDREIIGNVIVFYWKGEQIDSQKILLSKRLSKDRKTEINIGVEEMPNRNLMCIQDSLWLNKWYEKIIHQIRDDYCCIPLYSTIRKYLRDLGIFRKFESSNEKEPFSLSCRHLLFLKHSWHDVVLAGGGSSGSLTKSVWNR